MSDFRSFALAHGLIIDRLIADGAWHRVPTADHAHRRNGAYKLERNIGWAQNWATMDSPVMWKGQDAAPADWSATVAERRAKAEKMARQHAQAAAEARRMMGEAELAGHAYLVAKGLQKATGFVLDDVLLVPMRDHRTDDLINVQRIAKDGGKKFLPGGRAKGAVHVMGPRKAVRSKWLCEGYATGLSIRAAAESMMLPTQVIVCFSAGNMEHVAPYFSDAKVFADHDESRRGQEAAEKIGRPWVMSPLEGEDANDMHRRMGVRALVNLMQSV